jgi:hypothetical protein
MKFFSLPPRFFALPLLVWLLMVMASSIQAHPLIAWPADSTETDSIDQKDKDGIPLKAGAISMASLRG